MFKRKRAEKVLAIVLASIMLVSAGFISPEIQTQASEFNIDYENRLFSIDRVHNVNIVMDDWDAFIESCEDEQYSACKLVIDGEEIDNVAIRAKGNTSLSSVKASGSQRYSLKVEFDHFDKENTYHGLDKVCFNNLIQDNTMMKDYLVYQMMGAFGVNSPLCSFVYITVNGEDWGLYLAVEGVEDSFLQRNYGSKKGELYKPDSSGFGGGRGNGKGFDWNNNPWLQGGASEDSEGFQMPEGGFQMPEGGFQMPEGGFQMPEGGFQMPEGGFQMPEGGFKMGGGFGSDDVKLKYIDDDPESYSNIFDNAKTKISDKDKKTLISSLKSLSEYTDLENVLDMEEVLRYFVVHNFVVNGDSYTGSMVHNYYLHEKGGHLGMIPWDYNLAFGTFQGGNASSSVNASIDNPVSGDVDDRPMVGWIFSDEKYTEQYHELFSSFINEWISGGKLVKMIEDTAEMIRPYVEKDPTKFCTEEEFEKGVEAITQFVTLRGEAVKMQLNGDTTAVDTTGLNISDMGTMGMGFGGGFGGNFGGKSDGDSAGGFGGFGGFGRQRGDEKRQPGEKTKPDGSDEAGNKAESDNSQSENRPDSESNDKSDNKAKPDNSQSENKTDSDSNEKSDSKALPGSNQPDGKTENVNKDIPDEAGENSGTDNAEASDSSQSGMRIWLFIAAVIMFIAVIVAVVLIVVRKTQKKKTDK